MALLGPLKAHAGPCAAGPLAWALVSCTLTPTLWPRPTPVWGYLGLPLSPGRLSLRLVQLFQPGLCVRAWAAPGPGQMYTQQAPVSAQCRFCSMSTSCSSHVASVFPDCSCWWGRLAPPANQAPC